MIDLVQRYIWFLISPALIGAALLVRGAIRQLGLDATSAFLWLFRRRVRKAIASAMNLRRYCKIVASTPSVQFLQVPGADRSTSLRVDDLFVRLRLDIASNISKVYTDDNILEAANRIQIVGDQSGAYCVA